jgi:hypothetical protein
MAAPIPGTRGTPAGIKLKDGFSTKIDFAANPTVSFWEKTVKAPGIDGGDGIEQTTMHNTAWRTKAPRQLKTLTESTTKVAYDPNVYNQIYALVNVETTITVHFPDGSSLAFFGFLQKFEADDLQEGTQPEATVTITPTNFDPVGKVEAAPVLTSVPGT